MTDGLHAKGSYQLQYFHLMKGILSWSFQSTDRDGERLGETIHRIFFVFDSAIQTVWKSFCLLGRRLGISKKQSLMQPASIARRHQSIGTPMTDTHHMNDPSPEFRRATTPWIVVIFAWDPLMLASLT
jgi:hypothetical protein